MSAAVFLEDHGTVWRVIPRNHAVLQWLRDNVAEPQFWMGPALIVEWRYVAQLVEGMEEAGLLRWT